MIYPNELPQYICFGVFGNTRLVELESPENVFHEAKSLWVAVVPSKVRAKAPGLEAGKK
jgi:hypothetical protein